MITKWTIRNFKSFKDKIELEMLPLTILCGANSSGKSSIIQSILIVAQTLANKISTSPIVLNGKFTKMGHVSDIKSNNALPDDTIDIVCSYSPRNFESDFIYRHMRMQHYRKIKKNNFTISFSLKFKDHVRSRRISSPFSQPALIQSNISCIHSEINSSEVQTIDSDAKKNFTSIDCVRYLKNNNDGQGDMVLRATLKGNEDFDRDAYETDKPLLCSMRHFLPQQIICTLNKNRTISKIITEAMLYGNRSRWAWDFLFSMDDVGGKIPVSVFKMLRVRLEEILSSPRNPTELRRVKKLLPTYLSTLEVSEWLSRYIELSWATQKRIQELLAPISGELSQIIYELMSATENKGPFIKAERELPPFLAFAVEQTENHFTSRVKYLGPLREEPRPVYSVPPSEDVADIGIRGERTAGVLFALKDKDVKYISPESFKDDAINSVVKNGQLEIAVKEWLDYLQVASFVSSSDYGKLGYEVRVGTNNGESYHELTHVGVGVSQVLPILLMCLLASPGDTIIIEQPELHLHPKVQSLLADFFISMTLLGKQCIIETHSEYIIDKIRLRIALSEDNLVEKQVRVYFTEKEKEIASISEVKINKYGAIVNWPKGFFDQSYSQSESILVAASKKRMKNKGR